MVSKSTPESTTRFYERFVVRSSHPSIETPFSCSDQPFFTDIPNVPQEQKDFFYRVFMEEVDIFGECRIDWERMKELVLKGFSRAYGCLSLLSSYRFLTR